MSEHNPHQWDITSNERATADLKKFSSSKLTQTRWLIASDIEQAQLITNEAMLDLKKRGFKQIATQVLINGNIVIIIYYEV